MTVELRSYQEEAVGNVLRAWESHHATLVVSPTGTGKTVMFCALARMRRHTGRTLVVTHREELVYQATAKMVEAGIHHVAVEMAGRRAFPSSGSSADAGPRPDVVVASVATLSNPARLDAFPCEEFSTVIVDEAQHSVAATWKSLLSRFSHAKIVGFTATPDRADQRGLREVFGHVAFEMDLRTAIEQNYLVPIRQKSIEVQSLDLSNVKITAGDLDEHDLESALTQEGPLHEMAVPIAELSESRPTLIFAASVHHAFALETVLSRYTGKGTVCTVHGEMPRETRRDILARFHGGDLQYVVNCALLTEGFDAPRIACICMCRPTKSRGFYMQAVGRGTRLFPGKEDCLVLDFRGNAEKHKLVSLVDILGRDLSGEPDADAEDSNALQGEEQRADQESTLSQPTGAPVDPRVTVDAVYTEVDIDLAGRPQRVDDTRRKPSRSGISPERLDPFGWFGIERENEPNGWRALPCTEAQIYLLSSKGIDTRFLTRGDATDLITTLTNRAAKGLCTPRQAKFLAIRGLDTSVSFEEASKLIDQLINRGRRGAKWP